MERKNKIIISFLILLFVLFVLGFFLPKKEKKVEDEFKKEAILKAKFEWIKRNLPSDLALGEPLIFKEDCKRIKNKKERELCFANEYMFKASIQGKINWCKKIKDPDYQNYCQRTIAKKNNNFEECKLIRSIEWKNICFMEIAFQNKEKSTCNEIEYPFMKKKCQAWIDSEIGIENQDLKKCLLIPKAGDFRNICLWNIVLKKGLKICEEIKEKEDRNLCTDWYFLTFAEQKSKKENCEKIFDGKFKRICLKLIEEKSKGKEFYFQFDSDNDGVEDLNELGLNTDPFSKDTDKDGVLDNEELFIHHSDPLSKDTDGDGREDGREIQEKKDINKPD